MITQIFHTKLLLILSVTLMLALSCCSFANTADEAYQDALSKYQDGDYAAAIAGLKPMATEGSADAKSLLGVIYYNGSGVQADDQIAYQYFREAAELGNADAQFNLADMYMYVKQLPSDVNIEDRYQEAARWYFSAANNGHVEAQYTLGLLLLAGTGVVRDPDLALVWIGKAADAGFAEAESFMDDHEN